MGEEEREQRLEGLLEPGIAPIDDGDREGCQHLGLHPPHPLRRGSGERMTQIRIEAAPGGLPAKGALRAEEEPRELHAVSAREAWLAGWAPVAPSVR